jgi:hypothetical protein
MACIFLFMSPSLFLFFENIQISFFKIFLWIVSKAFRLGIGLNLNIQTNFWKFQIWKVFKNLFKFILVFPSSNSVQKYFEPLNFEPINLEKIWKDFFWSLSRSRPNSTCQPRPFFLGNSHSWPKPLRFSAQPAHDRGHLQPCDSSRRHSSRPSPRRTPPSIALPLRVEDNAPFLSPIKMSPPSFSPSRQRRPISSPCHFPSKTTDIEPHQAAGLLPPSDRLPPSATL